MVKRPVRVSDRTWDASRAELDLWIRSVTVDLLRLLSTWSPLRETIETAVDTLDEEKVPITRVIATTTPLQGGGDLSTNRTLTLLQSAIFHNNLSGRSTPVAHPATVISNAAAGSISATTVQAAINELDSEKVAKALHYPTALTVVAGTLVAGVVGDLASLGGTEVHIDEVAATPGFDIILDWTTIPSDPSEVFLSLRYSGNLSHLPTIECWDYTASAWVPVELVIDQPSHKLHTIPSWDDFMSGGNMRVRINHAAAGNPTHDIYLKYAAVRC